MLVYQSVLETSCNCWSWCWWRKVKHQLNTIFDKESYEILRCANFLSKNMAGGGSQKSTPTPPLHEPQAPHLKRLRYLKTQRLTVSSFRQLKTHQKGTLSTQQIHAESRQKSTCMCQLKNPKSLAQTGCNLFGTAKLEKSWKFSDDSTAEVAWNIRWAPTADVFMKFPLCMAQNQWVFTGVK